MKQYLVGIQVIEVWHMEVEAVSEDAAERTAYNLNVAQIRERGNLEHVETDYAEVVRERP